MLLLMMMKIKDIVLFSKRMCVCVCVFVKLILLKNNISTYTNAETLYR
jgi:hypothetical protein